MKVATTIEPEAIQIINICDRLGIQTYSGSVNNVLERFYLTALPESPDWVVRLTSDCPLIDHLVIDKVINCAISSNFDYVSNTLHPTYPDGIDTEVFKFSALEKAYREASLTSDLEHVTSYIWKNSSFKGGRLYSSSNVFNDKDYSSIRLTVDTFEDFKVIEKLITLIGKNRPWLEYVDKLENTPEVKQINEHIQRNEGYLKSLQNEKK